MGFRPWSDLPQELMEKVAKNLFITDEVMVRAVCKGWNSMRHVRPVNQLPLLLMSKSPNLQPIFDPSSEKTCNLNFNPRGDLVLASKHGWLLMRHGMKTTYFINPFTGVRIDLPRLNNDIYSGTFSSPPTSHDCVVCTLGTKTAYTCSPRDQRWKTICERTRCNPYRGQMVYMDGNFYIGDRHGHLAAFNVNNQKWNMVIQNMGFEGSYRNFLLESSGELLLVIEYFGDSNKRKSVSRLNNSMTRWETVESLGDRALFLGPTSFSVSESSATPGIENLIYTCERRSRPEYYSLEGEARTYSGLNPYSLTDGKGRGTCWVKVPPSA
ncbi:hypothetical protein GIB67_024513 [Kingdonia uniflora]|uniref:KIB1-4 beta-propeller domain-containing protein n=1 Tax=Kingdonia uniflora TaxID=39325 RepID=A0A7J7LNP8_9MAGN|nr:hypothetical protein GIB67_024513 [Kingdonia uniflora]